MTRAPWILSGILLLAVGILGWLYSGALRREREVGRLAEAGRMKAEGLLVTEQQKRQEVENRARELEKNNEDSKAQVATAVKLHPDLKTSLAIHGSTGGLTVGGDTRPCPTTPDSPDAGSKGRRVPPRKPHPRSTGALVGGSNQLLFGALQSEGAPAASTAPAGGSGPLVTEGLPRPEERGLPEEGQPPPGLCVLAQGDRAEITVDVVTLESKAGNTVVAGAAAVNRLSPEPKTTLLHGPFRSELSSAAQVAKQPETGRGFGLGAYATFWDGGQTVGPALALPSLRVLGTNLEGTLMVGVWPKVQGGAMAIVRW